jgi:hypothetical protein
MSTKIIQEILAYNALVQPGVYLYTQEDILLEQAGWPETDESKDEDFTTSPYWILTDDGAEPESIENDESLKKACPNSAYFAEPENDDDEDDND